MLRKIVLIILILIVLLIAAVVAAALLIDPDDYREELAARASQQLGREVRLDGPMELKLFPWLALDIRDVTVGNPADFAQAPPLASIEQASVAVRVWPLLRGEIEVGTVSIDRAEFYLVSTADERSNLDGLFGAEDPPPDDDGSFDLARVQTGPVRLHNVVLGLINLADDTRTDVHLDEVRLDPFQANRDVGLSVAGRLLDNQQSLLSFDFSGKLLARADLSQIALSDWTLDYALPNADIEGFARGNLSVANGGGPLIVTLDEFATELEAGGLPITLLARQAVEVRLDDPPRVSAPAMQLELADQRLDVDGEASLAEVISARLAVRGERLDLAALSAALPGGPETDQTSAAGDDFSALAALDLNFSLDLDELLLAEGLELSEVSARSRLRDGELLLDPLGARLFGGRFDGQARVDFMQQPPLVTLSPRLSGIRVAELAGLLTEQSPVDGSGEFSLDMQFQGLSAQQLLGSLNGSGSFAVAEGVLQGIDLEALIDDDLSGSTVQNISRAIGGQTRFNTLAGALEIVDGILKLPGLELSAAGYSAAGRGQIDLAGGRVDYLLDLDLGEEFSARLPDALRRATGGQIPVSIVGPLTRPTVSVDVASLAEDTVRHELGRRLLEALGDDDAPDEAVPQQHEAQARPDAPAEAEESVTVEEEVDERDQRREAARGLLRDLLGSGSDSKEDVEEESDPATENEPPPATL